ncbi:MAG: sporulation protein YabP [Clostridia bacterium]|nr:sporulation protein YabP [Clostridia bacterium]
MNNEAGNNQHNLTLENRHKMTISGVADVDSYDENGIVALTSMGELKITGSELHISRLDMDSGDMFIEGSISAISYNDRRQDARGMIRRLFG